MAARVVRLLLGKGAAVDAKDNDGKTALMLACGHMEVVQLLLRKGAVVGAERQSGRTALMGRASGASRRWCGCCSARARRSTRRTTTAGPR